MTIIEKIFSRGADKNVKPGDYVLLNITDTGSGMHETAKEIIFDPFYSTKGVWGKDAVSGTGMGLSICRNIAHEHDGDLKVESIVGVGTTFILTLPLTHAENCLDTSSTPDPKQLRLEGHRFSGSSSRSWFYCWRSSGAPPLPPLKTTRLAPMDVSSVRFDRGGS